MKINRSILDNLLKFNKHINIEFIDNTNKLEIKQYNFVITSLELKNNVIDDNLDCIYNAIINLENINLYIPKIFKK